MVISEPGSDHPLYFSGSSAHIQGRLYLRGRTTLFRQEVCHMLDIVFLATQEPIFNVSLDDLYFVQPYTVELSFGR